VCVVMFQSRFAEPVATGTKPHTIRPQRAEPIRVGDLLDLRAWKGKAYRSKQRKLRVAKVTGVSPIEIDNCEGLIWRGEYLMTAAEADAFAQRDGFFDRCEMVDWFKNMHGLPFKGVLIEWNV